MIAHWKGIVEEIHFGGSKCLRLSLRTSISKKIHLGPQNGPGSENLLKIVNCQNGQKIVLSHLENVGGPRYPPGSEQEDENLEKLKHVETENSKLRNTNIILKGELSSCEEDNYKLEKTINSLKEQLEDYEKLKAEFDHTRGSYY